MTVRVLHGDALDLLPTLSGLDSCVCDPPYHLTSIVKRFGATDEADETQTSERARGRADGYARLSRGFMGKEWDGGDIALRPETWRLVLAALKPGAHLLAFGGTRTFHRMACAIEDAGFEIRDTLMWVYGSGFPKSHDVSKAIDKHLGAERPVVGKSAWTQPAKSGHHGGLTGQHIARTDGRFTPNITAPATPEAAEWGGWGTALKPAWEPIILARRPLAGTVAENTLAHGVGGLNIDACRVPGADKEPLKKSFNPSARHEGWQRPWQDGRPLRVEHDGLGRWPANVLHDGSDEVLQFFPDAPGQQGLAKTDDSEQNNKVYGQLRHVTKNPNPRGDSGSAARFYYTAKADKDDRAGSRHPTVKPLALMRWLVRLVTPLGGTVLDCFAGSGTTGEAADLEGFSAVLIEREAEYIADIHRRLGRASGADTPLFVGAA